MDGFCGGDFNQRPAPYFKPLWMVVHLYFRFLVRFLVRNGSKTHYQQTTANIRPRSIWRILPFEVVAPILNYGNTTQNIRLVRRFHQYPQPVSGHQWVCAGDTHTQSVVGDAQYMFHTTNARCGRLCDSGSGPGSHSVCRTRSVYRVSLALLWAYSKYAEEGICCMYCVPVYSVWECICLDALPYNLNQMIPLLWCHFTD